MSVFKHCMSRYLNISFSFAVLKRFNRARVDVHHSGVLDDDADDTLINVNLIDDERAAKNVENKKKKPGYQAYDDSEFDEYGTVCDNAIVAFSTSA